MTGANGNDPVACVYLSKDRANAREYWSIYESTGLHKKAGKATNDENRRTFAKRLLIGLFLYFHFWLLLQWFNKSAIEHFAPF